MSCIFLQALTVATLQQISDFMAESFPQSKVSIEAVDAVSAIVRHAIGERHRIDRSLLGA